MVTNAAISFEEFAGKLEGITKGAMSGNHSSTGATTGTGGVTSGLTGHHHTSSTGATGTGLTGGNHIRNGELGVPRYNKTKLTVLFFRIRWLSQPHLKEFDFALSLKSLLASVNLLTGCHFSASSKISI